MRSEFCLAGGAQSWTTEERELRAYLNFCNSATAEIPHRSDFWKRDSGRENSLLLVGSGLSFDIYQLPARVELYFRSGEFALLAPFFFGWLAVTALCVPILGQP